MGRKKGSKVPILRRVKPETKAFLDECAEKGISLDKIVSRYEVLSFTSPIWKRTAAKRQEALTEERRAYRRLLVNYEATRERLFRHDITAAGELFREELRSRNLPLGFEHDILEIWEAVEAKAKPHYEET